MSGRKIALPNRTSLLFIVVAAGLWAVAYFHDSPLLDALGSVFAIIAIGLTFRDNRSGG